MGIVGIPRDSVRCCFVSFRFLPLRERLREGVEADRRLGEVEVEVEIKGEIEIQS